MTTIKSYTDIEQSRKLAEILPLGSADMWYQHTGISIKDGSEKPIYFPMVIRDCKSDEDIPCWSLAALFDVIPDSIYDNTDEFSQLEFSKRSIAYHDLNDKIKIGSLKDNLVDTCYEMILKLKKLNLL